MIQSMGVVWCMKVERRLLSWPRRKGGMSDGNFVVCDLVEKGHKYARVKGMICRAGRAIGACRLQGRQGGVPSGSSSLKQTFRWLPGRCCREDFCFGAWSCSVFCFARNGRSGGGRVQGQTVAPRKRIFRIEGYHFSRYGAAR